MEKSHRRLLNLKSLHYKRNRGCLFGLYKTKNILALPHKSLLIKLHLHRHLVTSVRMAQFRQSKSKKEKHSCYSDVILVSIPRTVQGFDQSKRTKEQPESLLMTLNFSHKTVCYFKDEMFVIDEYSMEKDTVHNKKSQKEDKCDKRISSLMDDLMSLKYFKIKPCEIQCYLVTQSTHPKLVNGTQWAAFKYEILRLRSFCQYPSSANISCLVLAREGFVYIGTGSDDKVMCFSCCVTKNNWVALEDVSVVHKTVSPQCPMVTGKDSGNISMDASNLDFNDLLNRINNITARKDENNTSHIETDSAPFASQENTVKNSALNGDNYKSSQAISSALQSDNISATSNTLQHEIIHSNQDKKPAPQNGPRDPRQSSSCSSMSAANATLPAVAPPTVSALEPRDYSGNLRNQVPSNHTQGSSLPNNVTEPQANETSNQPAAAGPSKPNTQQSYAGKSKDGKGPTYSELGIITERPKRTEYAVKLERIKTFAKWPPSHHIKLEDLADAGFYYAGYGDCARCFFCGGGLRNWEDEDDVWVEHARWFPKCAFIRQLMGQNFVDAVQDLNKTNDKITFTMVVGKMGSSASAFLLDSKKNPLRRDPAVQALLEFVNEEQIVLDIATTLKSQDAAISADVLLKKLKEETKDNGNFKNLNLKSFEGSSPDEDKEAIRAIKEKNNLLRQQTMCKICMDKDVEVVFLPCGHLVSCAECAGALTDCPVCRKPVKGTVRAFIS